MSQIADAVLDVLGKPPSLKAYVDERLGQVDRHIGSTDKAQRLLAAGYVADDGLATALACAVSLQRAVLLDAEPSLSANTLAPRAVGVMKASACRLKNRSAWMRRAFCTRAVSGTK